MIDSTDDQRLFDLYNAYFRVVRADTDELRADVYRLRFHVYAVEHKFERPDDFPDGQEKDIFDDHSVHSLLIHRPSETIAGTVRLILPDPARSIGSLPIDHVCSDPVLGGSPELPRTCTAEVSRFAVSKSFRRRLGEAGSPSGVTEESLRAEEEKAAHMGDRRIAPHITLGLIQSLVEMSIEHGVTHWCAVMERALLRLLTKIGIHFQDAGPLVEYHGRRQPCYRNLHDLLETVKQERFDVWEILTREGKLRP
jgi:N-acyl amino acid synthase of PEP-CTERM/exosortase system